MIVNYDSPWNATRLMQRIGRVNRIGSISDHIYNYMFYPSQDGDEQIQLYSNALIKLQGFHSALGEDAQVYSREEMLREFQLFDDKVRDNVDKQLELLREVRELYAKDHELYSKIKNLPCKSRTIRTSQYRPKGLAPKSTIVYLKTGNRSQFYKVNGDNLPEQIEFIEAAELLRAKMDEPTGAFEPLKDIHYKHVQKAYNAYDKEISTEETPEISIVEKKKDKNAVSALAFLREAKRTFSSDIIYTKILVIEKYVNEGVFSNLTLSLNRLSRDVTRMKKNSTIDELKPMIAMKLEYLYDHYNLTQEQKEFEKQINQTVIITSETLE